MNPVKLARISALVLVLFLSISALPAFAAPPCGCNFCQRFPDKNCTIDGAQQTCLEFLIVAFCPAQAASADAPSSEESFLAALSEPAQEPAAGLHPTTTTR